MLTTDSLKEFGADVDEGLVRCMNNSGFYIMLVGKVLDDKRLSQLESQLSEKNLDAAFETSHALKGMYSNLALTPLTRPISKMTELLRNRTDIDYTDLLNEAKTQFEKLCALK